MSTENIYVSFEYGQNSFSGLNDRAGWPQTFSKHNFFGLGNSRMDISNKNSKN